MFPEDEGKRENDFLFPSLVICLRLGIDIQPLCDMPNEGKVAWFLHCCFPGACRTTCRCATGSRVERCLVIWHCCISEVHTGQIVTVLEAQ